MSFWIILSWVFVVILTAVNVFIFLKLKSASEQMLQMAFPGSKNMQDALAKMQQMTQGMQGANRGGRGGNPLAALGGMAAKGGMPTKGGNRGGAGKGNMDAQLKAAMDMLQQMQKGAKR